jgi:DNA-binding SARP family transcriptional activator
MLRLLTLGGLSLADEHAHEVRRVLRRPKWVAFLCILATSRGWVARETLLALLWPDLDEPHARHALRQTLSEMNAALPGSTLLSEAGAGLMANPEYLWCDAAVLYAAAREDRHAEVCDLYGGEYLPGFDGSSHSRAFEEWIDGRRRDLRGHAHRSTWALAARAEAGGDTVGACQLAVRAADLEPYDEAVLRRTLRLLMRQGDRARAHEVFHIFRDRYDADLELVPSAQTLALLKEIGADP